MSLVAYAEDELKRAGYFDEDSDYGGMIGTAVLEMVKQMASEGHSGNSHFTCLSLFNRLARFRPLTPIQNPMLDNSYIDHTSLSGGTPTYQSNRLSSLFSEDGGKRWYDIDKRLPKWKRWLGIRRAYVKFPYMPE